MRSSAHSVILERSAALNAAEAQLKAAAADRGKSPDAWEAWSRVAEAGHAARDRFYSEELVEGVRRLEHGDGDAVEAGLVFLEADPWCFRSGYLKERLLRALARHALTGEQKTRIGSVLLRNVDVGERRELRLACRLARAHGTPRLRGELGRRLLTSEDAVARRALVMLFSLAEPNLDGRETHGANELIKQARSEVAAELEAVSTNPDWESFSFYVPSSSRLLARMALARSSS